MTRTSRRAADAAADSIPPKQLQLFADPERTEEATSAHDAALEILEQRAKEVYAHAKTGSVCESLTDKRLAIARIACLSLDMAKVANALAEEGTIERMADELARNGETSVEHADGTRSTARVVPGRSA